MRVVVTGASGNVGTSLLRALAGDGAVTSVLGLARRLPEIEVDKTTWAAADVAADDLTGHFRGADVVVHLAWLIQPSHDPFAMRRTHVVATERGRAAARPPRGGAAGGGRGGGGGLPLLGRGLLARAQGPPGRRGLADPRGHHLLLLARQGLPGAAARPVRARPPGRAGGAAAA